MVDTDGVVGDDSFSWCCHSGVVMAAKVTLSRIVYKKWMSGYVVGGKWVSDSEVRGFL